MGFVAEGARVLITGASSGIGAEMAERLAAQGAVVGLCARRADRLEAVLERCRVHSPASTMWVTDLTEIGAATQLASAAIDELGGVDLLVNNAGIPKRRHVAALTPAEVERVTRVNYLSPVELTLALLPHMLERDAAWIVQMSSVAATLSSPGEAAYDASKAALAVFSEAMAIDLWDTGITTLVVYPGVVDTELFSIPDNDPFTAPVDVITASELVDEVLAALARGDRELYVPSYFKDLAIGKAGNVVGFLEGAAEFVRQSRED